LTSVLKSEGLRKAFHMATVAVPVAVYWLPPSIWRWPLIGLALLVTGVDLVRLGSPRIGTYFARMLGPYLRKHERHELTGSTYLTLACVLSALVFPKAIAVAVMGYLILGDALAGLVGKTWGRRPLFFGKTWEGTLAGLAANLLVGALVFRSPEETLVGAFVASAVELLPFPLDDNFAIPVVTGVVLKLSFG